MADQLVSDKADLELELEKAKEKEAEIIRDRDKLKIKLVALEDKVTDTNNEIESLKDGKLDKQKIKELIAEETAELHDIIDDTCGKVSQLEADRSEGWSLHRFSYPTLDLGPLTDYFRSGDHYIELYKDLFKIIRAF